MKFKVFEENKEVKEKEVYFRLIEDDGEIDLIVCNKDGLMLAAGYVLSISADGLFLYDNVTETIDLPCNERGRVKVIDDE